jgi:hypothetical protein
LKKAILFLLKRRLTKREVIDCTFLKRHRLVWNYQSPAVIAFFTHGVVGGLAVQRPSEYEYLCTRTYEYAHQMPDAAKELVYKKDERILMISWSCFFGHTAERPRQSSERLFRVSSVIITSRESRVVIRHTD